MDIKAGFNNVPIHDNCLPYTGINTQDGLFRYRCMTFGFLGAPYHFQYIMDCMLSLDPKLLALVFFDNVTTHGAHW